MCELSVQHERFCLRKKGQSPWMRRVSLGGRYTDVQTSMGSTTSERKRFWQGKASIEVEPWEPLYVKTRSYLVGFATSILDVLGDHGKSARFIFHRSAVQRIMAPMGTRFEVEKLTGLETLGYGRQR